MKSIPIPVELLRDKTLTATAIAAIVGCSQSTVSNKRKVLRIDLRRKIPLTKAVIARLGKVQDRVIAKKYGVSESTVRDMRAGLGIPSYRSKR